jgi:hypothetical protein
MPELHEGSEQIFLTWNSEIVQKAFQNSELKTYFQWTKDFPCLSFCFYGK